MSEFSSTDRMGDQEGSARRPMIVVNDAHVEYRVHASGKRVSARESMVNLRALRGGRELKTVPALRGVSFTASEAESIGVVGHNGSGKSTLFRAISGLIPTSEGTILARDRPVLLGVNAALVPELSGENNIKLGLLAMGYTPEEAAASVDEIAEFAELNEFIHHPMRTYSSGMGARLRFAIASAKSHSILLIDEALSVGDRRFKVKSEERIRALRDSAGLVMLVSHSLGSIKDTCERVLWIHKGELVADGATKDVLADYVKWTKQPGGAVGAASAPKSKSPAPETSAAVAPPRQVAVVGEATSGRVRMGDASTDVARPGQPLGGTDKQRTVESTAGVETHPIGERTIARRERYRRTARQQRRGRIIAVAITAAAILAAVGAGAAIALLTRAPQPVDPPAVIDTPSPQALAGLPAIVSFDTSTPTVACESAEGEAAVIFDWQVNDAAEVAIAAGPAEVDAIDAPLEAALPTIALNHPAAFACSEEAQTYTLTAESVDGSRVSSVVTVTRAPLPEPTSEPEVPAEPVEPVQPVEPAPPVEPAQPPVEPAPQPSAPPVEPEPSPVPSQAPVEPQPSEQPSEEPPTEPEETTEPAEGAEQSAPAEQPESSPEPTTQP